MTNDAPELRNVLRALPRERLDRMNAAADEILECYRVLKKGGANIVGEILKGQGTFYEWDHYPEGDVYDDETHAQYYYHAHREGEHGHFHTFLRKKGMREDMSPVPYDGPEVWPAEEDEIICHLIAISMDSAGFPISLFTTNRWVTGENWYDKADVIDMLDSFIIDHSTPSWPANRWLTAMLQLFRPQIELLIIQRDEKIAKWREKKPDVDVFEDRDLEITSSLDIRVEDQIRAIKEVIQGRPN
ncbi:hypothetical protein GQF03_12225 [Sneathiella chungangensis]|uniref:DUF6969 domain-containing protein n=2 Tax=Sneathiella chungangensis TaxID=1418234 RepID=A0A845MJD8_9PROT|nr:hypothetical protein [Sneathiella chungangensis]